MRHCLQSVENLPLFYRSFNRTGFEHVVFASWTVNNTILRKCLTKSNAYWVTKPVKCHIWYAGCIHIHCRLSSIRNTSWIKTQDTPFLPITLENLTDFQSSFTIGLSYHCAIHWSLKVPPYLRETFVFRH